MDTDRLLKIAERVNELTPGEEWFLQDGCIWYKGKVETGILLEPLLSSSVVDLADLEFMASSRQDVPELLKYITSLEAALAQQAARNDLLEAEICGFRQGA